jgi:pyruvate dehydrogenase E2 component (dihydrolipoamide acetyltransferase)
MMIMQKLAFSVPGAVLLLLLLLLLLHLVTMPRLTATAAVSPQQGVTMTALLAKAAGVALAQHPVLYAGEWSVGGLMDRTALCVCVRMRVMTASGPSCCKRCLGLLVCHNVPAAVTPDGNGVTYNSHVNVSLAVAMPDGGLITPVLKVRIQRLEVKLLIGKGGN